MKKRVLKVISFLESCKSLYFLLSIILIGIFFGSLCVRFMGESSFTELNATLTATRPIENTVWLDIVIKEFVLLIAVLLFSFVPYGSIGIFLVLLYKGFSIGIVGGAYCFVFGLQGIRMIFVYLFLPNVFYLFSLCFWSDQMLRFSFNRGQTYISNATHLHSAYPQKKTVFYFFVFTIITSLGIITELMLS